MATGQSKVNIYLKKFLPQQQMVLNFLDYLRNQDIENLKLQYPNQGFFYGNSLAGSGPDEITAATPSLATDGQGNLLKLDPTEAVAKFENALGIPYSVGMRYNTLEQGTEVNVRTGQIEYTFFKDAIGEKGEPSAVIDNGTTLRVKVDSIFEVGVSHAGRQVIVYLKRAVGQADAFFTGTVQFIGGENVVDTTHLIGQTAGLVSTDPADYWVFAPGLTIRRNTDLSLDPLYVYFGIVTGVGAGNTPTPADIDTSGATVLYTGGSFSSVVDNLRSFLVGGGDISWDLANEELSWTVDLRVKLASRPFDYQMIPDTIVLTDGDCAYIDADGVTGGIKSLIVVPLADVPDVETAMPIVYRNGNDIVFRGGALELEGDDVEGTVTTGRIDGVTNDTLAYIGAKNESDATPDYTNATGVAKTNIHLTDNDDLTKSIKKLELRNDVIVKVKAVDWLSTVLPATPAVTIDGQALANGHRVLFAHPTLNGVYQVAGIGVAATWTKLPVFGGADSPSSLSMVGVQDSADEFIRNVFKWTAVGGWKPLDHSDVESEPTGFQKRTDSEISFDTGTRTFTIQPKAPATYFYYFQKGKPYRVESAKTVVIPNSSGLHFVYFDGETLVSSQVFDSDIILGKTIVSTVYWNATTSELVHLADERHSVVMDGMTHLYLHNTNGCQYASGLGITGSVVGDGSADSHAQVAIDSGRIYDEDLIIDIVDDPAPSEIFEQILSPIAQIPVFYKEGATGEWRKTTANDFPLKPGAARPQWNELQVGPTWATVDASADGKFIAMYLLATNDINEPVIAIMGQREDNSLIDAQNNNTIETLDLDGLPTLEFKSLYRIIYETDSTYANTINARQVEFTDLRFSDSAGGTGVTPTDHNALGGRGDAGAHPSSAVSTTVSDFGGAGSSLDLNVKSILKTIDDHFKALRIHEHPSNKQRVIVTGASTTLNTGTVLEQQIRNLIVKFDGIQIDFQTGEIFESDGVTPFNGGLNDFTPVIPPVGENRWASLTMLPSTVNADNTINFQPLILISDSNNFRAVFASGTKVGQVKLEEDTGAIADILQAAITQQGVGGGGGGDGTGDANSFLEDLKNRARSAFYRFFTPFIFAQQEDDEEDTVNTTANFDIANGEYDFSLGDILATINQLGSRFLGTSSTIKPEADQDLAKIEVWAKYTEGAEDPAPIVRASRDGRGEFQTVPMFRHGNSSLFIGELTFEEEAANQNLHEVPVADADTQAVLTDVGAGVKRAFQFVVTDKEAQKNLTLYLTKTGSPLGKLRVNVLKDDTGLPSTASTDRIGGNVSGDDVDISALIAGNNVASIPIGRVITKPGTYWVEIITDQEYKDSYNAGVDQLGIRVDTAGTFPDGATYDDGPGTWASTASETAVYLLEGMPFDLRIEIEASQNDVSLEAMGVLYALRDATVQQGLRLRHVERFSGDDDETEFTIPGGKFLPDVERLEVFDVYTGQVYKYPAFGVDGHKITFPAGTFLNPGEEVLLIFDQSKGVGFDYSEPNAALMAANHLGSTDGSIDRSIAGRGVILRRPDGTLREVALDDSDNIVILSVP